MHGPKLVVLQKNNRTPQYYSIEDSIFNYHYCYEMILSGQPTFMSRLISMCSESGNFEENPLHLHIWV